MQSDPALPDGIDSDRAADNWRVLCAIADLAGGSWPSDARKAALVLCGTKDSDTISDSVQLLNDIQRIFEKRTEIASADLVSSLVSIEGGLWSEYGKYRKAITTRQVAQLLRPFNVTPDSIRFGSSTLKGYKLSQFTDAFSRYASPAATGTAEQANDNNGCGDNDKRNRKPEVPDRKDVTAHKTFIVPDVPDQTVGVTGEEAI